MILFWVVGETATMGPEETLVIFFQISILFQMNHVIFPIETPSNAPSNILECRDMYWVLKCRSVPCQRQHRPIGQTTQAIQQKPPHSYNVVYDISSLYERWYVSEIIYLVKNDSLFSLSYWDSFMISLEEVCSSYNTLGLCFVKYPLQY